MSTLGNAIKIYGLEGLIAYAKLKARQTDALRLPGIRNTVRLRDNIADRKLFKQLIFHREYQLPLSLDPHFIIDAGANIGLSTLFFASSYPTAEIVAIEPEIRNFTLLRHNTRNYPNIRCLHAGVWSKPTTLEITNPTGSSTGFIVNEVPADNPSQTLGVTTTDILATYRKTFIDLYKMDIEGAEKEVLSENSDWLGKTKILIIELHDRKRPGCSRAFFQALCHYNFECHPFGQNLLLINRDLISPTIE